MRLQGTNQGQNRPFNRRIILETIRLKGPVSRADIARAVALSPQTVSTITRELEEANLLLSTRERPKRRGHPATMLRINPEGAFAIGLHLTPAGLQSALVDLSGGIVGRDARALDTLDPQRVFPLLGELVAQTRALRKDGRILGIGLAMPGPFNVEPMSFVGPTTMHGWDGVPIRERIAEETRLPVFVDIDAAAAALGESLYGRGHGLKKFFYLYFGVGLGGAMVHDGAPLRGAGGNVGEIGHMPIVENGDACPCGNSGCLERYVSLDALARRFRAAGRPHDLASITASLDRNDPIFNEWLAEAAPLLRRAIAIIENLYDPETIIAGGILPARLLDRLIEAAQPLLPSMAIRAARQVPRLVHSHASNDSALLGAGVLAISGVLSPKTGLQLVDAASARTPPDPLIDPIESPKYSSAA